MQKFKKRKIIYSSVSQIKINELLNLIFKCIKKKMKKKKYICLTNVHSVSESFTNSSFRIAQNSADLSLPDGKPIFWCIKLLGARHAQYLPGYFVTEKICELANNKNISIGFYGSSRSNLKKININLKSKFKKLKINLLYSPPYRELKDFEKKKNNFKNK